MGLSNPDSNVSIFLIITFLITWLFWLPGLLVSHTSLVSIKPAVLPLALLGTFVPSVAGIIFARREKEEGMWRRWFNARLGWFWIPVIFLLPVGGVAAHAINWYLNGEFRVEAPDFLMLPLQFVLNLFTGPVTEEFGWRGYLLPCLQRKLNALNASLLTGVIWVFWHIPAFFITGAPQAQLPFLQFALTTILVSIIITWVQNNAQQSLWPALIIHTTLNLTNELFPLFDTETGNALPWTYANVLLALVTIGLVGRYGFRTLTRGPVRA